MASNNQQPESTPEPFEQAVVRYLDGLANQDEFDRIQGQLVGSQEHRRVFVQLCFQAQSMAEGLGARELVGSELTDESPVVEPSDAYLEVIEQAVRARERHVIEHRANQQLAEDIRLQKIEAERARARAKMFQTSQVRRVIVIPKPVVYLGSGLVAAMLLLLVYLATAATSRSTSSGAVEGAGVATRTQSQSISSKFVAELISVSEDAAWADQSAGWTAGMPLEAGEINLAQGQIVVRLNDGAEVTLRAPVRFSVLNANHSELHHGQIRALVPESAHGFEVLIPGGVITDLGTEFTLVVPTPDQPEPAQVEVTDGLVTVAPRRAGQRGQAIPLRENQFANVSPDGLEVVAFEHTHEPVTLDTYNTGRGLRHMQPDARWRVRFEDDPQLYPAYVIAPEDWTHGAFASLAWDRGAPSSSQWISYYRNAYQDEERPDIYFYSTSFDIPENVDPNSVVLNLKMMVDNQVMAFRVNGELVAGALELPYPDAGRSAPQQYRAWVVESLSDCFVAGENTIEFEVLNDAAGTGLRVEMDAVGVQVYTTLPAR